MTYPTEKTHKCFPKKYVWFNIQDNDFRWAGEKSVEIFLDRCAFGDKEIPIEQVQEDFAQIMRLIAPLQGLGWCKYPLKLDDSWEEIPVTYTDEIRDSCMWNGSDIYVDTWTGEIIVV